ncbi:hypothetical protein AVEN_100720-1 [Araneus ventricosus]|uniref:Uncharacterized protein n=1 Tax=Araneus ventricosus TaxID=182803 RepID=A0A4Y2CSU9_ARAVE|nr:hypothetical protein AVEN_100720-1 [Araneus ventricosus]
MPVILYNESEEGDTPAPIDMVDEQLECEDIEFDPPKGCYYSNRQLSKGASPDKHLATVTGSIKHPFHRSSDSANQHHGVAPRVFTSQLSLNLFSDLNSYLQSPGEWPKN